MLRKAQFANGRLALRIAASALAIRIVSVVIAMLVSLSFPLNQPRQFTVGDSESHFLDTFARYDSGWYYQIARDGYQFVPGGASVGVGKPGKIAFFPVYPLATRYTARVFGDARTDVYLGGVLVSWASFILAMIALFFLARLDLPQPGAEQAVMLAAIFPFSFFFGMVYTEALFLLLVVLSFYGFRTRHWIAGGLAGGLATATRVNGILILPALVWIAYRNVGPLAKERLRAAAGLLLVPAGLAAYCFYIYQLTGDPFEWASTIREWGYAPGGRPWGAPVRLLQQLAHPYRYLTSDPMAPYDVLYGSTAVAFAAMTPFVWWKFGAGYGLFMALNLWLPLSSGTFEGAGRYCSVLFPAFIWMATIQSRAIATGLAVMFALFYTLGLTMFTTLHPIF